jgi:hypothetical protein
MYLNCYYRVETGSTDSPEKRKTPRRSAN